MSKLGIIFKREYMSRVTSKGFIIGTLVGPLFMAALIFGPVALIQLTGDDNTERVVAVVDETGVLFDRLRPSSNIELIPAEAPVDTLRAQVQQENIYGYLVLPSSLVGEGGASEGEAQFASLGGGGIAFSSALEGAVTRAVREARIESAGLPEDVLELARSRVDLDAVKITEAGEDAEDSAGVLFIVGYVMAFLMYFITFIYGSYVMQGVMEEKRSRIMEVIVSSAKPFDLMLGKVLALGALGLTQLLAWGILSAALLAAAAPIVALFLDPSDFNLPQGAEAQEIMAAADIVIPEIPVSLFVYFILFFIGGYLLYASLFAAVGSAVEEPQEAQQLLIPISIPLIVAVLLMASIVANPDGALATWSSIIPFLSPILMPARIAVTNVPFWQIGLSLVLLVAGFLFTIWLSARIYRIGILMYGKKPSFKDLAKWVRYA
jgi:ABC-2 type transport system permease protein